mgnify:FL=1
MRRIAATLAVVGALLFGAGSAWADLLARGIVKGEGHTLDAAKQVYV